MDLPGIDDVIGNYSEMTRDFRKVVRKIRDPGTQYSLVAFHEGEILDVLWLSLYDKKEHGQMRALEVSSRDLASDTAYHLNAVRFLNVSLKILIRDEPRYVVEPGASTRRWVRKRLGVESVRAYRDVILSGELGQWLMAPAEREKGALVERLKKTKRKLFKAQEVSRKLEQAREQLQEAKAEAAGTQAEAELKLAFELRDVGRATSLLGEWMRKAKDFEAQMMDHRLNELDLQNQLLENAIQPRKRQSLVA
jgi:hypothetical protein